MIYRQLVEFSGFAVAVRRDLWLLAVLVRCCVQRMAGTGPVCGALVDMLPGFRLAGPGCSPSR